MKRRVTPENINDHLQKLAGMLDSQSDREVNQAVRLAEQRERQKLREFVRGKRREAKRKSEDPELGSAVVRAAYQGQVQAYSQVLAFLAAREKNLSERRSK